MIQTIECRTAAEAWTLYFLACTRCGAHNVEAPVHRSRPGDALYAVTFTVPAEVVLNAYFDPKAAS